MANMLVEEVQRVSGAASSGLFQLTCNMLLSFRWGFWFVLSSVLLFWGQ